MKKIILSCLALSALVACESQDSSLVKNQEERPIAVRDLTQNEEVGRQLFKSIFYLEGNYVDRIEFAREAKEAYQALSSSDKEIIDSQDLIYRNLIENYIAREAPNFYSEFGTEMLSRDAYAMTTAYKNAVDMIFKATKNEMLEDMKDFMELCINNQVPLELFENTDFNSIEDIIQLKNRLEEDYNVINGKSEMVLFNIDKNFVHNIHRVTNKVININELLDLNKNFAFNRNRIVVFIDYTNIREQLILDIYNAI